MADNRNYRRGSLVWPIVLIGLGVLFLLNNLGIISWDIWSMMFRMWPVVIVAIGLDLLLGRRSGLGAAITAVVIIGLFAGFFWFLNLSGEVLTGERVSEPISYEIGDGEEARVRVDLNIGNLYMDSLDEDDELFVAGDVVIGENETLTNSFEEEDGVIDFALSSRGQQYYPNWVFVESPSSVKTWTLSFTPEVLIDLDVDSGVGKTELALQDLSLSALDVSGGVGEVYVTLPEEGQYDVHVSAGVGKIEVRVPAGLAAKVFVSAGLGNTSVVGDFTQRGDMYVSDGFESAEHSATIYLDGGVGNIRVVEMDN